MTIDEAMKLFFVSKGLFKCSLEAVGVLGGNAKNVNNVLSIPFVGSFPSGILVTFQLINSHFKFMFLSKILKSHSNGVFNFFKGRIGDVLVLSQKL